MAVPTRDCLAEASLKHRVVSAPGMFGPLGCTLAALAFSIATIALYGQGLDRSPIYLTQDEVFFGLNASSIATTGREINGDWLPLYFRWPGQIADNVWFQPVIVYATALVTTVLPVSQITVRLTTVLVAVADIVLIYFLARRLFQRERLALAAAGLLLLTPAHFIHGRVAMDYLYPVPFVLLWLLCLAYYVERGSTRTLIAGTLSLGIGFYSYIAAIVMMPLYLLATLVGLAIWRRPRRDYLAALGGFVMPITLGAAWLWRHPWALERTARRYELAAAPGGAGGSTLWDALASSMHFFAITDRVTLYWSFFNPSYLFLTGAVNVINSTRYAGVFLLPVAVLLVLGLHRLVKERRHPLDWLMIAGFVTAPLAACLVAEASAVQRELTLLPFAILIAVAGLDALAAARNRVWHWTAAGLLALCVLQFLVFRADYFGGYVTRSSNWFAASLRESFDVIAARERTPPSPPIVLSSALPYSEWYWRFYTLQHERADLLERSSFGSPDELAVHDLEPGTLILVPCDAASAFAEAADVRKIHEAQGSPPVCLLERK